MTEGLNREQWEERLAALGAALSALGSEASLEVIGAWPVIDAGMPGRSSLDLDVWMPGSQMDRSTLRAACETAGLDFDPIDEAARPYVQFVRPGIVQMPEHSAIPERRPAVRTRGHRRTLELSTKKSRLRLGGRGFDLATPASPQRARVAREPRL